MDPFDLICHVVFDQPPLTRKERANNVKKRNYFTKYGEQAKGVLEAILEKYADQGPEAIEAMEILKVQPLTEMGMDSLMAVELRNLLRGSLQQSLPATLVFDYPTVLALSDFLAIQIFGGDDTGKNKVAELAEEIQTYVKEGSMIKIISIDDIEIIYGNKIELGLFADPDTIETGHIKDIVDSIMVTS